MRLVGILLGLVACLTFSALAPGCSCAARASDPCPCGPACTCAPPCRCGEVKAALPAGPRWVSHADAERAASVGVPVFVLVTNSRTCPHCKKLEAGPLADPAVRAALGGFACVRLDTDTPAGAALAARYNARSVPRLLVYRNGALAAWRDGAPSAAELREFLR